MNRMSDYLSHLVHELSSWCAIHGKKDGWEDEQERCIEALVTALTPNERSELLSYYSIDDIILQSTKRYGKPFFMIYPHEQLLFHINHVHLDFTERLVEQLLWTHLQEQLAFCT